MTVIFVGLALLLITLVALLVLAFERSASLPASAQQPSAVPPPAPRKRLSKAKRPRGSPTNPFGMTEPTGAMILSRRVLRDLPLPPPSEVDLEEQIQTLVSVRHTPTVIVLEVED